MGGNWFHGEGTIKTKARFFSSAEQRVRFGRAIARVEARWLRLMKQAMKLLQVFTLHFL